MNTNGGVIIICGGTFSASSNARIGGDYSGAGKGGTPVPKNAGNPGGAGYGGAGGSDVDNGGLGGLGGVGGGGGGGDGLIAYNAGSENTTGGRGVCWDRDSSVMTGGTQGKTTGGASINAYCTGGGGAFGNAGNAYDVKGGQAGAVVMIVCKKLSCDLAAISTGGTGGLCTGIASGGGGSGLCYIACQEMI